MTSKGTSADGKKICAIQEWPQPQTEMDLRGLLRLAGYYIIFVQDYANWPHLDTAKLQKPEKGKADGRKCSRHSMSQKLKECWTETFEDSFRTLKQS